MKYNNNEKINVKDSAEEKMGEKSSDKLIKYITKDIIQMENKFNDNFKINEQILFFRGGKYEYH